jgi:hypothetical protein
VRKLNTDGNEDVLNHRYGAMKQGHAFIEMSLGGIYSRTKEGSSLF